MLIVKRNTAKHQERQKGVCKNTFVSDVCVCVCVCVCVFKVKYLYLASLSLLLHRLFSVFAERDSSCVAGASLLQRMWDLPD